MKRVGFLVLGVLVVIMLMAPVSVRVLRAGVALRPQVAAAADPLAGSGGPVCVAVPIFGGGNQGSCKQGQVEIPNDPGSGGAIVFYLKLVLKLVNGLIGGIIILVLVIAGIQYITSMADPSRVKAAKNRIVNAITALVLYMLMFAILNFLIPGGIL